MNSPVPRLRRPLALLTCAAAFALPATALAEEAPRAESRDAAPPARQETPAPAAKPALPKQELTSKILYQILLAEIAGRRGSIPLAAGIYADLARTTRDPRIAQRAAEFALFARQPDAALDIARLWVEMEPDSIQGRQILSSLLLATKHVEEAQPHLARVLELNMARVDPPREVDEDKPSGSRNRAPKPLAAGSAAADALEQLYRSLARHADKAVALQLLERLTAPYENLAETHFTRARAAVDAKDDARALAALDRALAIRPDWADAVLFKAQIQQRASSTLAEATLRDFLADYPGATEARIAHARVLVGAKRFEEARREFLVVLGVQPDNGDVLFAVALLSLQMNDIGPAEKHLKRLIEINHGDANMPRFYLGQIAEETRRPVEALSWYLQVTPGEHYVQALNRAAGLYVKEGRIDDGRLILRRAAANSPAESVPLLIAEAQILSGAGRHQEAFDLLDNELTNQPDQPQLLYESALMADKINRLDVLERNLRKLILLKPDDAHAYNALGYSLADRGLRLDEAQEFIDKGLTLAPNDPFILDSKGWLLYRRGDHQSAMDFLKKAFGLRPDPEIAAHLGEVLWVTGRREEALKMWNESIKVNPTNTLLVDTIKRFKP